MCTAISYLQGNHYFGRNLDMVSAYREEVTITPKNYVFFVQIHNFLLKNIKK